jgi:crotonobetainyl-CoA hydratase
MALILTSRRIGAEEARAYGLVNEVAASSDLIAATHRWCDQILQGAPRAIEASKATLLQGLDEASLEDAMRNQSQYPAFAAWRTSDDLLEGTRAFVEKRPPKWTGR